LETFRDAKDAGVISKRRSSLNIIAEILDAASDGACKTNIMYRVNVNFVQFNEYVKHLLEAKLINTVRRGERTIFETTGKGKLLLHRFGEAEEILNSVGKEENCKPLIVKRGPMVYLVKK